jgi:MYXO-CTERM domain-containing protein
MRLAPLLLVAAASAARAAPPCVCDPPWSFPNPPIVTPPPIGSPFDAGPPPIAHAPRNAQVFVSWPGAQADLFEWNRDDGTPVPFTVEPASDAAGQFWVRPAGLLDAGATYTVREGDNVISFLVDDAMDADPPEHTRALGQGARLKGRCPEHVAAEVRAVIETEVDGDDRVLSLDDTESYGVVYELIVRRLGYPDPMEKHLYVRGDQPVIGEVVSTDYRFQECFENYQGVETGWDYEASLRVYDQAGNPAEAPDSEARVTRFRFASNVSEGCGCHVGARPRGPLAPLALLAGLALIARRFRRT